MLLHFHVSHAFKLFLNINQIQDYIHSKNSTRQTIIYNGIYICIYLKKIVFDKENLISDILYKGAITWIVSRPQNQTRTSMNAIA